MVVN
ncbi:hypothetical protein D030_1986A, partial [Vibrio parahaemolyticus AQ3810]|jgi:hypothetical protein